MSWYQQDREKRLEKKRQLMLVLLLLLLSSIVLFGLFRVKSSGFEDPDEGLVLHAALDELITGQLAIAVDVKLHEDSGKEEKRLDNCLDDYLDFFCSHTLHLHKLAARWHG